MKRILLTLAACALTVTGIGLATNLTRAADEPKAKTAFELAEEPGNAHKELASHAGKWNISGAFNDMQTGKPISVSGEATIELILGDRFLSETNKVVTADGATCNGHGLVGYSNSEKAYQALYVSDKFTGMKVMNGQFDEKLGAIVFTGTKRNPVTNKLVDVRVVLIDQTDDKFTVEFYCKEVVDAEVDGPSPPDARPKIQPEEKKEGVLIYTRK